jgi:uncharacterized FlaG/YvyC family protein
MNISSINNLAAHVSAPTEPSQPKVTNPEQRALIQAVRAVNATDLLGQESELTFVLDRLAKKAIVRIVNKKTGELIRQIPSKEVLRLAEEARGR